jgi:hypothetical protein
LYSCQLSGPCFRLLEVGSVLAHSLPPAFGGGGVFLYTYLACSSLDGFLHCWLFESGCDNFMWSWLGCGCYFDDNLAGAAALIVPCNRLGACLIGAYFGVRKSSFCCATLSSQHHSSNRVAREWLNGHTPMVTALTRMPGGLPLVYNRRFQKICGRFRWPPARFCCSALIRSRDKGTYYYETWDESRTHWLGRVGQQERPTGTCRRPAILD